MRLARQTSFCNTAVTYGAIVEAPCKDRLNEMAGNIIELSKIPGRDLND
jgi:hypothetical protein